MEFLISNAYAQDAASQSSPYSMLIMMAVIFGAFYFLLIRPQQKRQKAHQELIKDLSTGDEVVTSGGIFGKIRGLSDHYVTLEIASNVEIKVQRSTVTQVLPKGSIDAA